MKFLTLALFLGAVTAEDFEDDIDMVHIHVSDAGRKIIEKELDDVELTAKKIRMTRPVRNLKNSLKRWGHSDEMDDLKELDKKFLASPPGKKLQLEIEDFAHSLKEHVTHDAKGIHVDHEGMQTIEDEIDDVQHDFKDLAKTHWAKKYEAAHKAVFGNKEFASVKRRVAKFKASPEFAMLKKELLELKKALKENVQVTDVPKDVEDLVDMLHIQLSKQGQLEIEKELGDVHKTMEAVKMTRSVRNMKNSLKRWKHSKEVGQLHALDQKFWASEEGQHLKLELQDIVHGLDGHIKKTPQGWHIDHEGVQYVQDDLDDVDHLMDELEDSKWDGLYKAAWKKAASNKEAKSVGRRFQHFKASKEWAMLHKELHELDASIKKNLKVTEMDDDMYLF